MKDFLQKFSDTTAKGENAFSNSREGTIVGLVSFSGTLHNDCRFRS